MQVRVFERYIPLIILDILSQFNLSTRGWNSLTYPVFFKDKSVISSTPTYFENKESPIICYKYNASICSTLLTILNLILKLLFLQVI